jgi:hypothetical protein
MRGTLLEFISQDYTYIREKETDIKEILETKRNDLLEMKETIKILGAKVKEYEQLDQLQTNLMALKAMMAWAQVEEREKELQKQDHELQKARKKIDPVDQQIAETEVCFLSFFFYSFTELYHLLVEK